MGLASKEYVSSNILQARVLGWQNNKELLPSGREGII